MNVLQTKISGLYIIEPQVFGDQRGYFFESYQKKRYAEAGIDVDFVQDNVTKSARGILRGLHIQLGDTVQGKLVQVLRGRALDVAVDARPDSPTYGQHVSIELSAENKKQFFIPRGFLHGFVALEDETLFTYKCDNYYSPSTELTVMYNDPDLGIEWGIEQPTLSKKDTAGIAFKDLKAKLF